MKNSIKIMAATLMTGVLFAGCSAVSLPGGSVSTAGSTSEAVAGGNPSQDASQRGASAAIPSGSLDEYQDAVNQLAATISSLQPSADLNARYQEYAQYDAQIDTLDHLLDTYEDQIEYALSTGNMAPESYQNEKYQVELMENQLDSLEDQLELKYQMDD